MLQMKVRPKHRHQIGKYWPSGHEIQLVVTMKIKFYTGIGLDDPPFFRQKCTWQLEKVMIRPQIY